MAAMGLRRALQRRSAWWWLVLALLLLEVAATGFDLVWGPHDRLHWEEAINARAGVLLACGHLDRIWNLQYQSFCGGCTADAVLGAGLFSFLPPTVQNFKLIPLAFHLMLVLAGVGLAWRAASGRGALIFLVLSLGTPTVFRQLGLTGWGNHAESMGFPILAAWLLVRGGDSGRAARWAGLAGAVAGLGAWYCYTSAHALPVLVALALWRPRGWRTGAAFIAGVAVGLGPWWAYLAHRPELLGTLARPEAAHFLPRPSEMFTYLAGPAMVRGLWPGLGPGPEGALWGGATWYGLWALALLGAAAVARSAWPTPRRPDPTGSGGEPSPQRSAALYGPLALAALLAAYAWRHGAWYGPNGRLTTDLLGLRYLSPLLPTLALCAAAGQAPGVWRPLRHTALLLAIALGVGGFTLRVQEWNSRPGSRANRSVCAQIGPAGPPAYPEASPALVAHLVGEPDEPLLCRRDHMIELAGSLCARDVVPPLAAEVLAAARSPVEAQSFLDPCMQQTWGGRWNEPGGCGADTWRELLETTCAQIGPDCGGWRPEVAASVLRAAPWVCINEGVDARTLGDDAALHAAWCRLQGEDAVFQIHEARGELATLVLHADCARERSWAWGVGWAWSRWFGCGAGSRSIWRRAGGPALGRFAQEGRISGCGVYAPRALGP